MATKRKLDVSQEGLDASSTRQFDVVNRRYRHDPHHTNAKHPTSADASPRMSPGPRVCPTFSNPNRKYEADASIVLVGIRGVGKSTLGVIAATALRYRLVDADRYFFQATGHSRSSFKNAYGAEQYRLKEVETTRSILLENPSKAVIICGPGSVEGTGQRLLLNFAKEHPVIFIERETGEIQKHVGINDTKAFLHLLQLSRQKFRAISTFEFYNISESCTSEIENSADMTDFVPISLILKKVERDFLQFILNITSCRAIYAPPNLFLQLPHLKGFSYALWLPMSGLNYILPKLQNSDTMADAINFVIDLPTAMDGHSAFDETIASIISKQFHRVRRYFHLPILFEVQLPTAANHATAIPLDEKEVQELYFEILHFGLRLAPEYLCVDIRFDRERVRRLLTSRGSTKIIGHYFDQASGSNGWEKGNRKELYHQAQIMGCDIVRLCQHANSAADNITVQQFRTDIKHSNDHHLPLIAYNTGNLGRTSCCFNPIFTPVTHPLLRSQPSVSIPDWLLTVPEAQNALFASFSLSRMYFGILGADVNSSLSPAMHNKAFKLLGMPHEYRVLQRTSVDDVKALTQDPHFGGASITAPFKTDIIAVIDCLSPEADAIGAVNTLICRRAADHLLGGNIALYGDNTDWKGIHTCVRRSLSPINAVRPRTTGLVLGAGGMARAAVYTMIRLGVQKIFIWNRTVENAKQMANHFHGQKLTTDAGETAIPHFCRDSGDRLADGSERFGEVSCSIKILQSTRKWPAEAQLPTIVISCVPGYDNEGALIDLTLPQDWLGSQNGGVVVELAYNPVETALVKQARELGGQGWIVVDGLQVLPEQAILQFEMFTGRKAPRKMMRAEAHCRYADAAE